MPIVINTSMPALIAQNSLTKATWQLTRALERMSTGNRINSAADDPAGSYFASRINTKLRGNAIVSQNVQSGYNMLATASDDLMVINDHLQRIKELATEYANGSNTVEQQNAIKNEVQQRVDEINRISGDSNFNDLKLLDGSRGAVRLQIGTGTDAATNSVSIDDVFLKATTGQDGIKLFGGTGDGQYADVSVAFASEDTASKFIGAVDASIDIVSERISNAGVWQNRLSSVSSLLMTQNENLSAAYSTVMDTDIAAESANYVKYQILQQTSATMLAQASQISGMLALQLVNNLA